MIMHIGTYWSYLWTINSFTNTWVNHTVHVHTTFKWIQTCPFSNKIEDASSPSMILSVGKGTLANFKIVGNRSIVAASYINKCISCDKQTRHNISTHAKYVTHAKICYNYIQNVVLYGLLIGWL